MADTVTKLVLTKKFTYRDVNDELFSNVYEFSDAPPSSFTEWHTLAQLVWDTEARIFTSGVQLMHAVGHDNNDPHAQNVYIEDFSLANLVGGYVPGTALKSAGDQA